MNAAESNDASSWTGGYDVKTGKFTDITKDGKTYKAMTAAELSNFFGSGDINDRFEGAALKAFGQKRNQRNKNGHRTKSGHYPDAISDVILMEKGKTSSIEHDNWEIKLQQQRAISDEDQMRGLVDDVAESKAGKQGIGSVWVITGANTPISDELRMYAAKKGINLFHTAAYRDPDNPNVIHFVQWRGVSPTFGAMKYNLLYSKVGPFVAQYEKKQ
jgi:hypothetical protein